MPHTWLKFGARQVFTKFFDKAIKKGLVYLISLSVYFNLATKIL